MPSRRVDTSGEHVLADLGGDRESVAVAERLREISLAVYRNIAAYCAGKGIIVADTKFEFGMLGDEIILIDEVLTPDSSRFWDVDEYRVGIVPASDTGASASLMLKVGLSLLATKTANFRSYSMVKYITTSL